MIVCCFSVKCFTMFDKSDAIILTGTVVTANLESGFNDIMATLQKLGAETKCLLEHAQTRLGRAEDNEIVLEDETVSGYHALVTIRPVRGGEDGYDYILEDLNSTNKIFVNNKETTRHILREGDIIRLGNTRLKFSTRKYVPPQNRFKQTQKLDIRKPQGYVFPK